MSASEVAVNLDPPTTPSTVRRWHENGVRGRRLQGLRRAGRVFFKMSVVEAFLNEIAEQAGSTIPAA
jgi:hypothetical protein